MLLQLRIYIVYGRSKKLLWSNAVFFVVELVLVFLLFVKTASKIKSTYLCPHVRSAFRVILIHRNPGRRAGDADAALQNVQHLPQRDGLLFRRTCAPASSPPPFSYEPTVLTALLLETYLLVLMLRKSWANRDALRALADEEDSPGSIMDVLVRGSVFYVLVCAVLFSEIRS